MSWPCYNVAKSFAAMMCTPLHVDFLTLKQDQQREVRLNTKTYNLVRNCQSAIKCKVGSKARAHAKSIESSVLYHYLLGI